MMLTLEEKIARLLDKIRLAEFGLTPLPEFSSNLAQKQAKAVRILLQRNISRVLQLVEDFEKANPSIPEEPPPAEPPAEGPRSDHRSSSEARRR